MEIPHSVMRRLREEEHERSAQRPRVHEMLNGALGGPPSLPVHFINGSWWVDLNPQGGRLSHLQDLKIQKLLEVGTVVRDTERDLMRIWDGEGWLVITGEQLARYHLDAELRPFVEERLTLTPEAIDQLKAAVVEMEEESERLALRQLLAESQQEEEGDGPD